MKVTTYLNVFIVARKKVNKCWNRTQFPNQYFVSSVIRHIEYCPNDLYDNIFYIDTICISETQFIRSISNGLLLKRY